MSQRARLQVLVWMIGLGSSTCCKYMRASFKSSHALRWGLGWVSHIYRSRVLFVLPFKAFSEIDLPLPVYISDLHVDPYVL